MTAIIRSYNLESKRPCAQFEKEELGKFFVRSFKDKTERINCVTGPGGLR